jgi:hypothetical protein
MPFVRQMEILQKADVAWFLSENETATKKL